MLHLLPVRHLLTGIVGLIALAVLSAVYFGLVGTGDALADATWIIRTSSIIALALMLIPYVAWRCLPGLQRLIFPYLGGDWAGELDFRGPRGSGSREVTLTIRHSLLRIVLILDSAESTSRTLVVQAERDSGINRDLLYYIYLNERKEGMPGRDECYRGLAVLRVDMSDNLTLYGDYFTEQRGAGELRLRRYRRHAWWALWK